MKPKYSGRKRKSIRPISSALLLKNTNFVERRLMQSPKRFLKKKAKALRERQHRANVEKISSSSEIEELDSGSRLSTTTTSSSRQPSKYIALNLSERSHDKSWTNVSSSDENSASSDDSDSETEQHVVLHGDQVLVKGSTSDTMRSTILETAHESEDISELNSEKKNFWLFESERSDMAVLVLRHPCSVILSGHLKVLSLSGSAELHGWQLSACNTDHLEFVSVFSSKQCGSLVLTTVEPEHLPKHIRLVQHLSARLQTIAAELLTSSVISVSTKDCVVVALTRLDLPGPLLYATTKLNPSLFSPQPSPYCCPRLGFSVLAQAPEALHVSDFHRDIAQQICHSIQYARSVGSAAPRIVVCGDRNTGKSTFIRYLINSILSSDVCSPVIHLDGDPGQSEFTPSSCVTLTRVDFPLLGPPLTHQKTPIRQCFVGGPNVEDTPDLYSRSLSKLISYYDENLTEEPLIVNTMGWTRGLGLCLLVDVLRTSRPNLVIQMDNQTANLPILNSQFLIEECGWSSTRSQAEINLDIDFKRVNAFNDAELSPADIVQLGPSAHVHRSLSALTYLGRVVRNKSSEEKLLTEIVPRCVPWCAVGVMLFSKITLKQECLLDVINGSWVALCSVPTSQFASSGNPALPKLLNSLENHCIGFGLIRAIDEKQETILILTPEPMSRLQGVNALAIAGDPLPNIIYTSQEIEGPLPYVSRTSVESKAGLGVKIKQTHKRFL